MQWWWWWLPWLNLHLKLTSWNLQLSEWASVSPEESYPPGSFIHFPHCTFTRSTEDWICEWKGKYTHPSHHSLISEAHSFFSQYPGSTKTNVQISHILSWCFNMWCCCGKRNSEEYANTCTPIYCGNKILLV